MLFTNTHGLPHEVYESLVYDDYDAGESDYSVTTLLNPPRIVQLQRRHNDEIVEDAMDRVWNMFGTIAHNMFERHVHEEAQAEIRLYAKILDRLIGGKFDNYRDGLISDYKITSAWTIVYGSRIKEWEEQLNIYAWLLRQKGEPIYKIRINCVLRDWDKNKAKQNADYPQTPIKIIPITVWSDDRVLKLLRERVQIQKEAESSSDFELPCCTATEMWEQPSKWALMKKGGKRAIRVFDDPEEAKTYSEENGENYFVETRPGKRTRCEDYCSVNCFCSQYKEYCETKES